MKLEKSNTCDCGATNAIQSALYAQDSQYWNVICDSAADVAATLTPKNAQWIYMQPMYCHYLIYAI